MVYVYSVNLAREIFLRLGSRPTHPLPQRNVSLRFRSAGVEFIGAILGLIKRLWLQVRIVGLDLSLSPCADGQPNRR